VVVTGATGTIGRAVTTGQRVVPAFLERLGFEFRYPDLDTALRDVLSTASDGPRWRRDLTFDGD
jgi:NAD dependent epimerase/dehydratase family enzyme